MKKSKHMRDRMAQRAISDDLVTLAREFGDPRGDGRIVLGRKALKGLREAVQAYQRRIEGALQKGGVVVVEADGTLITTYRLNRRLYRGLIREERIT